MQKKFIKMLGAGLCFGLLGTGKLGAAVLDRG